VRKLLHMAVAVVPAAGWWLSHEVSVALAAALLVASAIVDLARRYWPSLNGLLWRLLPTTFRSSERRRVLGSTWLGLGVLATLLLFGRDVGGTAVLFLVWGDPVAELVGRSFGQPGRRKTLAGSLGCFGACLLAAVVGVQLGGLDPWPALAGALVATLVERWSPPPDDNVWMPLLGALAIGVAGWVGSDLGHKALP
jgi:dolichol kinase